MILSRRSVQARYSFSSESLTPSYTYNLFATILHPTSRYKEEIIATRGIFQWARARDDRSTRAYYWPDFQERLVYITKGAVIEHKCSSHTNITIRLV